MDEERIHTIAFSAFPQIGPVRFSLLKKYFGSVKKAYHVSKDQLLSIHLSEAIASAFISFRNSFDIDGYIKRLVASDVFVLIPGDKDYSKLLSEIPDLPIVLYRKGNQYVLNEEPARMIAVVGTRHITPYGREMTERLVGGLVSNGMTIISGLAYGVDACAHRQTLALGGKTIAVLGSGVDVISPLGNARIYEDILKSGGAIVSEYPLGFEATKWSFPLRNRIISGLSLGVLVTEGDERSGSLITARRAAEQGRDVFAVPGAVTNPLSRGPAKLLKDGAILVERVEDILEPLGLMKKYQQLPHKNGISGQTSDECVILALLSKSGRMYIDTIAKETKLQTAVVSQICSVLEVRGIVKHYGGNVYGIIE